MLKNDAVHSKMLTGRPAYGYALYHIDHTTLINAQVMMNFSSSNFSFSFKNHIDTCGTLLAAC